MQDDLTSKQNDYAIFLPAISGFYATFIGKQRVNNDYVDPARMPAGIQDMEMMNWLNSQKSLFPYKWSLYSGGHANIDLTKDDPAEDMVRKREAGTFMLGDSGGFQIAKGLWEGEWRDPTSPEVKQKLIDLQAKGKEIIPVLDKLGNPVLDKKGNPKTVTVDHAKNYQDLIDAAQKKRDAILKWLDGISDYGMILDIPTWVVHDKKASRACGITTLDEAVAATRYNNDYFMRHRQGKNNGGAKFLNVLQGDNHTSAEEWYQEMKEYCDPAKYPDTHFDGWAMGGQNMCDVHLVLKRLVALRYDNLLQEGVHDWMHFLGTSKLEWAVLLTVIQRAVRKYVNPAFTISFDCASPFLATANGQVYFENVFEHQDKWSYRMAPVLDNKKYASDTRKWGATLLTDLPKDSNIKNWQDSPISSMLTMKDICIYGPSDLNKNGKEGKTSWDSFSYALLMGHNVWMHITAVQEANRRFDAGEYPYMMEYSGPDREKFEDIVESIFAAPDQETALEIIEHYTKYWMEIVGTRGFKGKKALNGRTKAKEHFVIEGSGSKDDKVKKEQPKPVLNPDIFGV
jgi:hypothetical protein